MLFDPPNSFCSFDKTASNESNSMTKTILILLYVILFVEFQVMAQVSQSKFKSWLFNKALKSKEADLNRFVSRNNCLLTRFYV